MGLPPEKRTGNKPPALVRERPTGQKEKGFSASLSERFLKKRMFASREKKRKIWEEIGKEEPHGRSMRNPVKKKGEGAGVPPPKRRPMRGGEIKGQNKKKRCS